MAGAVRPLAWIAVTVLGPLAGCATPTAESARSTPMTASRPGIELLGFAECPNTPVLRSSLAAALASIGGEWTFTETDQERLPEDDLRRGYPAPTILVNGRDLYGLPAPTGTAMGCRVYPGGVPDADDIAGRIRAATAE